MTTETSRPSSQDGRSYPFAGTRYSASTQCTPRWFPEPPEMTATRANQLPEESRRHSIKSPAHGVSEPYSRLCLTHTCRVGCFAGSRSDWYSERSTKPTHAE